MVRAGVAWMLLAASAMAQDGPRIAWDATPVWAARTALADAQGLPADVATRSRYVWLRGGSRDELAALSFVVNSTLSRVNIGILPGTSPGAVPFAGGRLVRLDFGILATDADDLANLAATWEKLARVETDFGTTIETREIVTIPRTFIDGKWRTRQWKVARVRFQAPPEAVELSAILGGTGVPIVDLRELQRFSLGTLNGACYYEFRGITADMKIGEYLISRGASREQVEKLESIEKAVVTFSKVTGKERLVAIFRGAGVRPTAGGGIVAMTFDLTDAEKAAADSPFRNLLSFEGSAIEMLVELPNGYIEATLWNAKDGTLVRVVPQNVAMDTTIPGPFTKNLVPIGSCITCHAPGGAWQGFENDVPKILASGVDVFGDLSSAESQPKQAQLLAGLYNGPSWFQAGIGPLAVARLTHSHACFQTTGKDAEGIGAIIQQFRDGYEYTLLNVWDVARELGIEGIEPSDDNPGTTADLTKACEQMKAFIKVAPIEGAIAREDPAIGLVLGGVPITRTTYESAKHLMMERAYQRGAK